MVWEVTSRVNGCGGRLAIGGHVRDLLRLDKGFNSVRSNEQPSEQGADASN